MPSDGGHLNTDVTAGKKANETISFSADEHALMGITDIADSYDYTVDTYRQTIGNSNLLNSLGLSVIYNSEEEAFSQGGVRIVSKWLVPDPSELSDNIHLLLLSENGSAEELCFDIIDDSISINGYMTDFLCFSNWVVPGNSAVLKVELDGPSLEKNGVTKLEDITEIELAVEVRGNDYNTVADPAIIFAGKPALN